MRATMPPVYHYCRLAHRGCVIFLLVRLNEQQQPKTTFYIFHRPDHGPALAHGFYRDLGSLQQAEASLKSWVEAYHRAEVHSIQRLAT
ncbi:hypothetical protein [Hymenobacter sp. GOD-10R]|uniref:hypothetical protein n=1 Tax=Hymenobacter sp. GOD-10R TaxID=3093922 RepID=UPI002D79BB48|nr:hypothetical protein [Hymenobacter sp. GOD-10R]WRQ31976.1 hypothetical protein SD425_29625 [Hymenobacter sp. GOD-10R]